MNPMPELENIFAEALALEDPVQQQDFLDSVCEDNAVLRNRVGRLIEANRRAHEFMAEPAAIIELDDLCSRETMDNLPGEKVGDEIDRYRLVEQIGEGGMGWVFKAEQLEPLNRHVALKVVKPGLDTREVIARFAAERQALARMEHPHIAKVLDAGTTPSGRPYFVMDLVDGLPLVEFCNHLQLTVRQRLEVFIPICQAIQHAHQKGVIHRDIKPRNILVSEHAGDLDPKVIDFGISKAIDTTSEVSSYETRFGQLVGTPAYMSPEQADTHHQDLDTRTDVYSLGATLYELLAGVPPFDVSRLQTKSSDEIRRLIQEETPLDPSRAILSTIDDSATVGQHGAMPTDLASTIKGELDWIVLRALEKEPDRRYPTAIALAEDIQRYLDQEVVLARPVSKRYRMRKFVQRHRKMVATGIAFATLLLIATTLSVALAIWGQQKQNLAVQKQALAAAKVESLRQVNQFIRDGLFASAGPRDEPNRNVKLSTIVHRAVQRLENGAPLSPDVEGPIRATIGEIYQGLGDYRLSLVHLSRAHKLFLESESDGLELARTGNEMAESHLLLQEYDEAEALLKDSRRIAKELGDNELRLSTTKLEAWLQQSTGHWQRAEELLLDVRDTYEVTRGKQHPAFFKSLADLGFLYLATDRIQEAKPLLKKAHAGLTATGIWDPATLKVSVRLAETHLRTGEIELAESLYRNAVHDTQQHLGDQNAQTLMAKQGLAQIRFLHQQYAEATQLLREVLLVQQQQFGADHALTLATTRNLAMASAAIGEWQAAELLYRRELDGWRNVLTAAEGSHPNQTRLTSALSRLAFHYVNRTEFGKAIPLYEELVHRLAEAHDPDHEETLIGQAMLGLCYFKTGDVESAEKLATQTLNQCETTYPEGWLRPIVQGQLGEVLMAKNQREAAEINLVRSYDMLKDREDDVPMTWKPMSLRAATRRLAQFYESSEEATAKELAEQFRDEYGQLIGAAAKERANSGVPNSEGLRSGAPNSGEQEENGSKGDVGTN